MEEIDCDTRRVFQPSAFGSCFGMGIRRFEFILRCLSFGDMDPMDRWSPRRPFLAAINERCQQVIDPSYILVEDELMSSWISRKQDRTIDGIPHLTKIIRKPKGVGTEIKCLADGVVRIMLRLEICEGKEAESKKKCSHLPAGTAHTLRVSEPWHGTGRIIVADSAFSSVMLCWHTISNIALILKLSMSLLMIFLIFNEFDGHAPENEQRRLSSDSNAELSGDRFEYVCAFCCSFQCPPTQKPVVSSSLSRSCRV